MRLFCVKQTRPISLHFGSNGGNHVKTAFQAYSSFDHCWQHTVDRDCHWPEVDLVIIFNTSFYSILVTLFLPYFIDTFINCGVFVIPLYLC